MLVGGTIDSRIAVVQFDRFSTMPIDGHFRTSVGFVNACLWNNSTTWRTQSHNLQVFSHPQMARLQRLSPIVRHQK